jgi:predicted nucleotidyltransferase component of viral defense system
MIAENILETWREKAPWPLLGQVEQDLIISRALVELYNNDYLKTRIAFRGGTALHKIVLPKPLRYSEDIDLTRLETGPVKQVVDMVRDSLDLMLHKPKKVKSTDRSVKIVYHYGSVDGGIRKLKIEINVRETLPEKALQSVPFSVDSAYFQGTSTIMAFHTEEMISTKIRALYQRSKGRDLFDLYALSKTNVNWNNVISGFKKLNVAASQKDLMDNLDAKMRDQEFLMDIIPLLPVGVEYNANEAYRWFLNEIIPRMK